VNLTLGGIYRRVELPAVHEPETPEYDLGGLALSLIHIGPMLIGAIIGGVMA
jgi:hypothetical protein